MIQKTRISMKNLSPKMIMAKKPWNKEYTTLKKNQKKDKKKNKPLKIRNLCS